MKKIKILSVLTALVMAVSACTAQKAETNTNQQAETDVVSESKETVTLSVYVEEEDRYIIEETKVKAEENKSAFLILKELVMENKIHMEFDGNDETAYVIGIDNLYAGDKGEMSGWMLFVNGEPAQIGAGQLIPQKDDKIEWIYVTDYTTVG